MNSLPAARERLPQRRSAKAVRLRRSRRRDDERGLTTLEWLLIVAAVAGLAALAVVVVQGVVTDTSDQIAGSGARITTAKIEAEKITSDANDDLPDNLGANRMTTRRRTLRETSRRSTTSTGNDAYGSKLPTQRRLKMPSLHRLRLGTQLMRTLAATTSLATRTMRIGRVAQSARLMRSSPREAWRRTRPS